MRLARGWGWGWGVLVAGVEKTDKRESDNVKWI